MQHNTTNSHSKAFCWLPAYSLTEAAQIARISQRSLYRLVNAGKLRTTVIGGRRIVPGDALRQLIERGVGQ